MYNFGEAPRNTVSTIESKYAAAAAAVHNLAIARQKPTCSSAARRRIELRTARSGGCKCLGTVDAQ